MCFLILQPSLSTRTVTLCPVMTLFRAFRPTAFEDLIAIVSLDRPGPMDNSPTYAARKAGLEPLRLPHPALKELLTETQGIPVYQEQIMRMAQILAGYTLDRKSTRLNSSH